MHPLQKDCAADNPKKFAAWCWAGGVPDPGVNRPDPIPLISPQLVEGISEMLWDFGFRHHPDRQTRWINGGAGLGATAPVVKEKPKVDAFDVAAEKFLGVNNPKLLEAIRTAPPDKVAALLNDLEKNFSEIGQLIRLIKDKDARGAT